MCLSIFLLWLVSIPLSAHAGGHRAHPLNCGGEEEEFNGLTYYSDERFISVGNKSALKEPNLSPILSTLRYFPNAKAKKYCYHFRVHKNGRFLVKTIYYYGGFDGGKEPPVFDQIIDGTIWSMVNTTEDYKNGQSSYYEAIVEPHNKALSVCLARNQYTKSAPFISALEVEYIDSSMYNSTNFEKYALVTVARHTFGSSEVISYPDDIYNRYWQPYTDNNQNTTTQTEINTLEFWNNPPEKAFASALTASKGTTLTIKWPPYSLPDSLYYIALYFQDNRKPGPSSWRSFDISINGQKFYSNVNVSTDGVTVYGTEWPLKQNTEISLTPRNDSPDGPIINAGEVYQLLVMGSRTATRDVVAMVEISQFFDNPPEDWHGDPCMPKEYPWTGVKCLESDELRIVSIDLTGFGISGRLSPSIAKLTALTDLWLGNNKLSGTIPDMSQLDSLTNLHLENNQFEGPIPESLANLHHLHELYLHYNKLNGTVPKAIKDNHGLKLQVSPGNHLSG